MKIAIGLGVGAAAPAGDYVAPTGIVFTTQPSIAPSSGEASATFTMSEGIATGTPAPTLTGVLTLNGTDVTAGMVGLTYSPLQAGDLVWTVTASNDNDPDVSASASATVTPATANTYSATVAALSTPNVDGVAIFDSGAARGVNAATIPLSGTTDAPDGETIEARLVEKGTSTEVVGWTPIAATASGAWSGAMTGVRSDVRLTCQVRVAGSSAAAASLVNDIVVGHIVVLLGQSEDDRGMDESAIFNRPAYQSNPTFADPAAEDSVWVMRSDPEASGRLFSTAGFELVNNASPVTRSLAQFADSFTRSAPGEKLLLIDGTVSGTNRSDLADGNAQGSAGRTWGPSFHDALSILRAYGADAGLCMDSWTAADSKSGTGFQESFTPFYTGRTFAGASYTLGATGPQGLEWPNILWDLGGANPGGFAAGNVAFGTNTRLAFHGPHRFEDHNGAQVPLVDPGATYAGAYVSNVADTSGSLNVSNTQQLNVIDAPAGAVTVEGSADGSTGWTTVYTGTPTGTVPLTAQFRYYRVTATNGGRFMVTEVGSLLIDKQDTRDNIRNMVASPVFAPIMRPKGPEIVLYQNGTPVDVAGGNKDTDFNPAGPFWTDWSHPSDFSDDGLPMRFRHIAIATCYALGVGPAAATAHLVPKFNRAYWEPAGAYAEFWYEAPDGSTPAITTTRLLRSEALPAATQGHHQEVAGFYLDGLPATGTVSIQAGRVRIAPASGSFTSSTSVTYLPGGASGVVTFPDDELRHIWKDLPCVDMGFKGVGGAVLPVALEPLPAASDIASTLAGPATFTIAGSAPYFVDPSNLGSGVDQLTVAMKIKIDPSVTATCDLLEQAAGGITTNFTGVGGNLRFTSIENGGGTMILPGTQTGSLSLQGDVWYTMVLAYDLLNGTARAWINGALDIDVALTSSGVQLQSNRALSFFQDSGNEFAGEVEYLRVWKGAISTDGTEPAAAPYVDITGPKETANAHPWKQGADSLGGSAGSGGAPAPSSATLTNADGMTIDVDDITASAETADGVFLVTGAATVTAASVATYTINPAFNGAQGWYGGGTMAANYAAPAALPVTLAAEGNTFTAAVLDTSGTIAVNGHGFWTAAHTVTRVASIPGGTGDLFAPSVVNHTGRGAAERIDVDAFLATLPKYSATGIAVPPAAGVVSRLGSHPNLWAVNPAVANRNGGKYFKKEYAYRNGNSNYGSEIDGTHGAAFIGVITDAWSDAERKQVLTRLISQGKQLYHFILGEGDGDKFADPNGTINGYQALPVMVYLAATSQKAALAGFLQGPSGKWLTNQIGHMFRVTQATLDDMEPHNDLTKPFLSRIRPVLALGAGADQIVIETNRAGDAGKFAIDPVTSAGFYRAGAQAQKIVGGVRDALAPSLVQAISNRNTPNGVSSLTVTLGPGHGLVPGDSIIFDPAPAYSSWLAIGKAEYGLEVRNIPFSYCPTSSASYRPGDDSMGAAIAHRVLNFGTDDDASYELYAQYVTESWSAQTVLQKVKAQTYQDPASGTFYDTEATFQAVLGSTVGTA